MNYRIVSRLIGIMPKLLLAALSLAALSAPTPARAADFQEHWVYGTASFATDAETQHFIQFLKQCRDCGVTHVTIMDLMFNQIDQHGPKGWTLLDGIPPDYRDNVSRVLDEAKQDNITLVPLLVGAGAGKWALFGGDGNLQAGIPARNVPFVVSGGVGAPDPSAVPTIVNGDFDEVKDGKPVGWTVPAGAAGCFSADPIVRHGETGASVKLSNFAALVPVRRNGYPSRQVFFYQEFEGVKPFQYYRLSFWMKTENCPDKAGDFTDITSSGGMRRNTFQALADVPATSDWKRYEVTLNTFEVPDGKLKLGLGVGNAGTGGGSVWFDDVKLEPAGMLLILRSPVKPLVVTNATGTVTYVEGRDFTPVADPVISRRPYSDVPSIDHPAPRLELTPDSRIKEGQRLLVSFYHSMCVYEHSTCLSDQDPHVLELIERAARSMISAWPTGHYFLPEDEYRVSGWEVQPDGQHLTPGQLLARLTKAEYDIVQKYSPHATLYVWSDMYNPYHNARAFDHDSFEGSGYYYLCNGNYVDAIAGLPQDVVVANWWTPAHDQRGPKFFADHGYRQIIAGYYDSPTEKGMKGNITHWMEATQGVPNVIGIMYTTWMQHYEAMPEYFRLVKAYPNFAADPNSNYELYGK